MGRGETVSDAYIEFQHVTKSFDERMVLDDVSFRVERGETCVIMGRSGVGKSVALKHIIQERVRLPFLHPGHECSKNTLGDASIRFSHGGGKAFLYLIDPQAQRRHFINDA